jgi:hypothetical protein
MSRARIVRMEKTVADALANARVRIDERRTPGGMLRRVVEITSRYGVRR